MSFHLNSPVKGFDSVGILARASSTSFWVKILQTRSATYLEVWVPRQKTNQLAFARLGSWGIAKAVHTAQGKETKPQMLLSSDSSRLVSSGRRGIYAHVHPPPPSQAARPVQPGKHCRHQEAGEQRPDRGEDLNDRVASSQLVRLVVAGGNVHHRGEVTSLEEADAVAG